MAAKTRVCVVGGLYLQARNIRPTRDIDVVVKSGPGIDRFKIRDNITRIDPRFTINFDGKCGLTYRENPDDEVISFNVIDDRVTLYMPDGMTLEEVVKTEAVPLPTDSEAIAMKLLASSNRLKSRTKEAVKDFGDAILLFGKLYHEEGEIYYKSPEENKLVERAFESFYLTYKAAKEELGEMFWNEDEWKVFFKLN